MAMLGLATSELPPTFPLPQTTPVPTVGSTSLDELTTIGPDFRLTTSTSAPDIGGSDEVDYVTEQNGGEEKSPATAGTPTFFPTESQASTSPSSPSLSTLPDERSSVAERGSTPDSSSGYEERETQTLDERSKDKGGQEETETEGTIEDPFAKETQRESFVTEEYLNNDVTTESSDIAEPSTKGASFGENPPESFLNVITTDSSVPSITTTSEESTARIPIDSSITGDYTTISPTLKDMSIELTTDEPTDTEDGNGKDRSSQRDTGPSTVFVMEDSATTEFNVVQVSREELSDANVVTTTRPSTTGQTGGNNFQDESTDPSDAFTTRPIDNGASGVRSKESEEEMVGREAEPVGESPTSQTTESDASGESAAAPPDQSSSTGAEKIGIIHETAIDTSGNALSVEDLTNLLKNKSLVFNPEDVDFDGLSEEFGNDTLIIIEDILVDSNGRVINSTATTNLADGILPDGLDSNLLDSVENILDGPNDQDQNSQTVNAGERHKGKAKEEGDQIAGSDHRGNSGTDKGEVEIDDDAGPSQSSIRPEIDTGGTAIPPNPATGTENLPADPTENEDNAVDGVSEDIPIKDIIRPEASSEDHAVNMFDPDTNLSAGAAGEGNVMRERQRDEPGADEEDGGTTAATTSGQESDGPDAAAGGKSSRDREGVADQQKNEGDAENYSSDQVTRPSVPTDYTLNDGSDQTTTETSTNPATPVSRKVEDDDLEESIPSMVPGLKEEDVDFEEQEEECFRRYTEARRTVDISYYNTTVRTRLLTAICLEGIRCEPGQDSTRCQFLHSKCNQQVDTSRLSFGMRVTLSECTVEDVLCHLGHRTPVMCCQDR